MYHFMYHLFYVPFILCTILDTHKMASVVASQPQNALGDLMAFPLSWMITEMVRKEANQ